MFQTTWSISSLFIWPELNHQSGGASWFQVRVTLSQLHRILQVVMRWENYHFHRFIVDAAYYGEPDPEYGDDIKDDQRTRLREIARKEGDNFVYEYNFGDS